MSAMTGKNFNTIVFNADAQKQLFQMTAKVVLTDVIVKYGLQSALPRPAAQVSDSGTKRKGKTGSYSCHRCDVHSLSKNEISDHIYADHGSSCHVCGKVYSKAKAYKLPKHFRSKHKPSGDVASGQVTARLETAERLVTNGPSADEKMFDPPTTSRSAPNQEDTDVFTCVECNNLKFPSLSGITNHMLTCHSKGPPERDLGAASASTSFQAEKDESQSTELGSSVSMCTLRLPKEWQDDSPEASLERHSPEPASDPLQVNDPLANLKFLVNHGNPRDSKDCHNSTTRQLPVEKAASSKQTISALDSTSSWHDLKHKYKARGHAEAHLHKMATPELKEAPHATDAPPQAKVPKRKEWKFHQYSAASTSATKADVQHHKEALSEKLSKPHTTIYNKSTVAPKSETSEERKSRLASAFNVTHASNVSHTHHKLVDATVTATLVPSDQVPNMPGSLVSSQPQINHGLSAHIGGSLSHQHRPRDSNRSDLPLTTSMCNTSNLDQPPRAADVTSQQAPIPHVNIPPMDSQVSSVTQSAATVSSIILPSHVNARTAVHSDSTLQSRTLPHHQALYSRTQNTTQPAATLLASNQTRAVPVSSCSLPLSTVSPEQVQSLPAQPHATSASHGGRFDTPSSQSLVACRVCRHMFHKTDMQRHFLTSHPTYLRQQRKTQSQPVRRRPHVLYTQLLFRCDYCNYTTPDEKLLADHIVTRHQHKFLKRCSQCDYESLFQTNLQQHIDVHHPQRYCDMCHFTSRNPVLLNDHVATVHLGLT